MNRLRRWLWWLEIAYVREVLTEEGYPYGFGWEPIDGVVGTALTDGPGVIALATADGQLVSAVAVESIRQQWQALHPPDNAMLVAVVATRDFHLARKLASRLS